MELFQKISNIFTLDKQQILNQFDTYTSSLDGEYTHINMDDELNPRWSGGNYKNGKKHGRWVSWDEFNEISNITYYKNGNHCRLVNGNDFDSPEIDYHITYPDDELEEIIDNEVKDGKVIEYLESGDLSSILNYKNGKLHGKCVSYYECLVGIGRGMLYSEGFFKNGIRHGRFVWVNKKGSVIKEEIYNNGKLIDTIEDNISGSKRKEYLGSEMFEIVNYKNEIKHGKVTRYYEHDRLFGYGHYKDGKLNGEFKTFDENGNIHREGKHKDNRENGIIKIYNKGILVKEETYKDGRLIETKEY